MMTEEEIRKEKIREIRKKISGLAYLKYVAATANPQPMRYEKKDAIPKDMEL